MTDYKQLSEELYEALKEASFYLPADRRFPIANSVLNALQKYEQETARGS